MGFTVFLYFTSYLYLRFNYFVVRICTIIPTTVKICWVTGQVVKRSVWIFSIFQLIHDELLFDPTGASRKIKKTWRQSFNHGSALIPKRTLHRNLYRPTFLGSPCGEPTHNALRQRAAADVKKKLLRARRDIMINCLFKNTEEARPTFTSPPWLSYTVERGVNYLSALSLSYLDREGVHLIVSQENPVSSKVG